MASFIQKISIALIVSVAICSASPARLDRQRSNKSKFLARQEVAEDIPAQTPYPPAGIQPEVKFALPTEEKIDDEPEKTYLPPVGEPAKNYGPPAKTYGPPEATVKDEVEQFANDEPQAEETKSGEPRLEKPDAEEDSSEKPEESDEEEPENQDQQGQAEPAGIEAEEIEAEAVKDEEEVKNQLPARLVQSRVNRQKSAKLQIATPQIVQPIYYFNYNGQLFRLLN